MSINEQQEFEWKLLRTLKRFTVLLIIAKLHKDQKTVTALNKRIAPFEKYYDRYLKAYKQQAAQMEMEHRNQQMIEDSGTGNNRFSRTIIFIIYLQTCKSTRYRFFMYW